MNQCSTKSSVMLPKLIAGFVLATVTTFSFAQAPSWNDLRKQSSALFMKRDLDGAIALEKQALAIAEKTSPNDPRIIKNLGAMATAYSLQGKHQMAIPLYERAIAMSDKGPADMMIKAKLNDLAAAYKAVGRDADAKKAKARAEAMN